MAYFCIACLGLALFAIQNEMTNILGAISLIGGLTMHLLYQENKPITISRFAGHLALVLCFCFSTAVCFAAFGWFFVNTDPLTRALVIVSIAAP